MANITIRNLDEGVKKRLQLHAVQHGRSMEEEARVILRESVADEDESRNLAEFIRSCFAPLGGVELEPPQREPMCEPPGFS